MRLKENSYQSDSRSTARHIGHFILTIAVTILPLCLGAVFCRLYRVHPERFAAICNEDGLVENLQFLFFFATGVLGLLLMVRFWRAADKLNALAYGLFGLLCVFIAMEEISWGQRIFGFSTPETLTGNI
jgi:hypothetical protein